MRGVKSLWRQQDHANAGTSARAERLCGQRAPLPGIGVGFERPKREEIEKEKDFS